ncbi:MAG: hybrid sensor histidine kinase/response regulator [Nevskiaceae bacterium]|nr:MAG: hybrid sensor histidine kinase/response regulator [Nevskiaceae bacterium]
MTAAPRPQINKGLQWVRGEFDQSLARARGLIESHIETPSDLLPLQQALVELHNVRGTANMIQCHGVAMIAEEMKQVLHEMMQGRIKETEPAYSALLGASVQIADYVDALTTGMDDAVLILQPLLNELRLSRGKPLSTESDLFASQIASLGMNLPPSPGVREPGAAQVEARRLLPLFQSAMLHWLRNDAEALASLRRIGKIAEQIATLALTTPVHQIWRTVAALAEALLSRSLDDSLELRRALGATVQQIKLLAEAGEDAVAARPDGLAGQLLFFVGRARAATPRVGALRQHFHLDAYLPGAAQVEALRQRLRGPGSGLLARVAEELRNDFAQVKDSIDLAVRAGGKAGPRLDETRAHLGRIANTLAALGLPDLQRVVANQARLLESLQGQAEAGSLWMDVATSILRVELSLENALFRQIGRAALKDIELDEQVPPSRDLAEGVAALLRESLVNMARLKSAVDAYTRGAESQPPVESKRLVGNVAAALSILQDDRAAALVARLGYYIVNPAFAALRESKSRADRFADAVAAVEYYLEAVRDHLPQAGAILENLTGYIDQLELIDPAATTHPPANVELPAEAPAAATVVVAEEVEPEIRDIFLEEAGEVRSTLDAALPRLRRDIEDRDTLAAVRRAFHTLKGSGRMVGAQQIGEFGWALENLLNRCLDGSIPVGPAVTDTVADAVRLLPGLIESFRSREPNDPAVLALIAQANNLAQGREATESEEPDMAAIFREDAREKLDAVSQWLHAQDRVYDWFAIDGEVVRSFHTLRGAAHVVNAPAISELAGALETYLDSTRGAGLELPRAALLLIGDATLELREWVEAVGTPAVATQDAAPWLARIRELQSVVPDQAQHASEERQLAEIFSSEALDLVQGIEQTAWAWARAPENRQAASEIKNLCHTLLGAALMSQCPAIATPTRALHRRMDEAITEAIRPSPGFFEALAEIVEGLYQLLDRYREGTLDEDGSALAARINALAWKAESAPVGEIIEMPPVATPAETVMPVEAPAPAPAAPTPPGAADADDPELAGIFLAEARELLEHLDAYSAAWQESPYSVETGTELKRVVHTLKGSARMAGYASLGEAGARLEQQVIHALREGRPDAALFARLHQASDVLHRALADMERGQVPDLSVLLADAAPTLSEPGSDSGIETTEITLETPAPDESSETIVLEMPEPAAAAPEAAIAPDAPIVLEGGSLETPPRPAFEPLIAAPVAPAVPAASADDELAEIFGGEASELLETLQSSLAAWQREPRELAPAREMQRALHTFKGGARMAGLNAMGNAAHEMETRINHLELQGSGDAVAFAQLSTELDALYHMHDLLLRGDLASLRSGVAPPDDISPQALSDLPPPVDAMPEPSAVEPQPTPAQASPALPPAAEGLWDPQLFWKPEDEQAGLAALRRETARVPVESLDGMLNQAGEISIYRSRLEEHQSGLQAQLNEMSQAIARIREQLRLMDIETDAQISARGLGHSQERHDRYAGDFDPLEMDRYTRMQELSRALTESIGDLSALHATMDELVSEADTLLLQQQRINTDVQQGLMRTLMVPFSRQVARLQRVVKQTAQENGKEAEAQFEGIESELDRNVLERITAPLEHLLRNSVVHGIEEPAARSAAGKPTTGVVTVSLRREGAQLLVELRDDGKGLDFDAIRATAIKRGLMPADAVVADADVAQFIFEPGFSTAKKLTQDAGRGIGMDVVAAEVKQLGGTLEIGSETGKGARFLIRLPLNLAISQALLVSVADEMYAIPLPSIEGIARIAREQLDAYYDEQGPVFSYGGHEYRVRYLGDFIGVDRPQGGESKTVSAILVRVGEGLGAHERRVAVVVDTLHGNREVVSKAVGPQISSVTGISSATILADGRVVLILDVPALAQDRARRALITAAAKAEADAGADQRDLVMVVDDSITIRRVTERLLLKHGYRVSTAKDGLDAMARLQTEHPAVVLLDIEMPRADGFEVATFIRNNERIRNVPIIMITSRSGDKHRERAMQIGVNRYLIKPYQEDQLISEVQGVMREVASL